MLRRVCKTYGVYSGTSMASPHLAGTVALMWSVAPSLVGDIVGTRAVLDSTAVDTDDASCGGTVENNNVWGEGRLDAYAAVDSAPRGPTGTLSGTVTASSTGAPLTGATLRLTASDGKLRSTSTDAAGSYAMVLPIGVYAASVSSFGYLGLLYYDFATRVSFEVVLFENGQILLQYATGTGDLDRGSSATIGIENATGSDGLQYSYNEPSIEAGTAVLYSLPPSGMVRGVVTDGNDQLPIAGAVVEARLGAEQVRSVVADGQGRYQLQVPVGTYTIVASRDRYVSQSRSLAVGQDQVLTSDFVLATARAAVTPANMQLVTLAGERRQRTLSLQNTGSIPLEWSVAESGGRRQTTVSTAKIARNPQAQPNARDTRSTKHEQGDCGHE